MRWATHSPHSACTQRISLRATEAHCKRIKNRRLDSQLRDSPQLHSVALVAQSQLALMHKLLHFKKEDITLKALL